MAHFPPQWKNICCNPFNRPSHFIRKKNQLRQVTKKVCEKFPSILPGEKICDDCRKKVAKFSPPKPSEPSEPSDNSSESDRIVSPSGEVFQVDTCESLLVVNQYLDTTGETPITKRKLQSKKYSKQKVEKITSIMQKSWVMCRRQMMRLKSLPN